MRRAKAGGWANPIPAGDNGLHNEIDIELLGNNPTRVQVNYDKRGGSEHKAPMPLTRRRRMGAGGVSPTLILSFTDTMIFMLSSLDSVPKTALEEVHRA